MKEISIYLAGAMSGLTFEESNEWREYAKEKMIKLTSYYFSNPSLVCCINPNDYYNFQTIKHKSEHEVKEFDLYKLKHSDLVLVNLENINTSIGTAMELQVAHDNNIPIVTFGDIINVHPWITDTIWRTEDTLEDACKYIVNYFL